jgi:hypothetical protein
MAYSIANGNALDDRFECYPLTLSAMTRLAASVYLSGLDRAVREFVAVTP